MTYWQTEYSKFVANRSLAFQRCLLQWSQGAVLSSGPKGLELKYPKAVNTDVCFAVASYKLGFPV